jgi:hypothetical protein
LIYADEFPEDPKDGELAEEWGLHVGRPFYVVS